nr:reverse transcriptase domain-containing protein [Tanacetum cinerariifolium]
MSTFTNPIIIPSDSDIEDAFSSTHSSDYISASPDYFPALPGNTSSDPSEDLSKYLLASLAISPFYDDPYMKVMQAYNATSNESPILPQAPIAPPTVILPSRKRARSRSSSSTSALPQRDFDKLETKLQKARTQIARLQREQMGHDDEINLARIKISTLQMIIEDIQVRHQSDMKSLLDKIHKLKNHKVIIDRMAPKKTSTSTAPAMNQAAIRKLVADSVVAALEAQATTIANTNKTNRNTRKRETLVARKCSYKEFMSYQPFNFEGTEGAVGLIRWFERIESIFSHSNCTKDCKVKFATGTLSEEAFSW